MRWQGYIFIFLLVFLIWQILIFNPQELEKKTEEAAFETVDAQQAPQWMSGIHLVESQDGERDWELWSEKAQGHDSGERWLLEGVKVQFYSKNNQDVVVTGERGTVQIQSKDMIIEGNVKTVTKNGYIFRSSRLDYNSQNKSLITDSSVKMYGPKKNGVRQFELTGINMFADLNSGLIEVKKQVKTRMRKRERFFTVNSQSAQFSTKSKKAEFFGDVVIDVGTLRVTGPKASFKYSKGELESVRVVGGIRVSDLDKWATSKTVDIEFGTDMFVFQGNPKLVQNNDELVGEVITFFNGGKKVKVDRARAKVDKNDIERPQ